MEHAAMRNRELWLGLALGLAVAGCSRSQVDDDVHGLKRTGNEVGATVREGVETAKAGAERVKQKLPEATQRARDELVAVGSEVKNTLKAAGDKVREGARATGDAVKDKKPNHE